MGTTSRGRAAGFWVDVRMHQKKLLPVHWGFWKTRYCLAGPSHVCYFRRSNFTADPDEVVICDGVKLHPRDSRVACLCNSGEIVAWLMLIDAATCSNFIATARPMIQGSHISPESSELHTEEQQAWPAGQLQLEAMQAQLRRHETELALYRRNVAGEATPVEVMRVRHSRPASSEPRSSSVSSSRNVAGERTTVEVMRGRHSLPASSEARSSSVSSSSSAEDGEPLVTAMIGDAAMDWPLSRDEKKLRIMQILDRERAVVEKENRDLKRLSGSGGFKTPRDCKTPRG